MSNYGYWGVELTGPLLKLEQAGYELVFTTPKGKRPVALPPRYDTNYHDPPVGVCVTIESDAKEVMAIKDDPRLQRAHAFIKFLAARLLKAERRVLCRY